jgi:iron-sulfur cluster repair protein YtfE (RIC family)
VRIKDLRKGMTMPTITQPLREEHSELVPHIDALCTVADGIGDVPLIETRRGLDEAYIFLTRHLIPHAQAEDAALYPVVARAMGAPEATATMSRDHAAVGQLVDELATLRQEIGSGTLDHSGERSLRRVLYGLYALIRVHFAKEEEIYLPLLDDRLSAEDAAEMFEAMEEAGRRAHGISPP